MKLRNKKTGEIVEAHEIDLTDNYVYVIIFRAGDYDTKQYNSLAELNEEWEDYEEPKRYWFVDSGGEVGEATYLTDRDRTNLRNFGNYFETEDEAEKAAERLRALTRLKDNGFRFVGWQYDVTNQKYIITMEEKDFEEWVVGSKKADLDLLFGGKE